MKTGLILLIALALCSGETVNKRKLAVYGLDFARNNISPFLEFRSPFANAHAFPFVPVTADYPYLPFKSINGFAFPHNEFSFHEYPTNLRDVLHKPAVVVFKSKPEAEDLEAYFLEHGLSSLADNPQTHFIHDKIKTGAEKAAVVVHPTLLNKSPIFNNLKGLPVSKFEFPAGFKFANFVRSFNNNLPFVFIYDKESSNTFDSDSLLKLGSFDVTNEKIVCSSCHY